MNFKPVATLSDLETLNEAEIIEGYTTTQRGDPEPGPNRGRSFWHGWRNRMIDLGILPPDTHSKALAKQFTNHPKTTKPPSTTTPTKEILTKKPKILRAECGRTVIS